MAKKPRENLVWNAQVRQMMLDGESEISAFTHVAACDPSDAHKVLDKLVGRSTHAPTTEISTWAVTAIAKAWNRYVAAGGDLSLGQAFNLESTVRGGHDSLQRDARRRESFDLSVLVEDLIDQGLSKTKAIETVAASHNRTPAQLTKALKHPTKAELENLRRMNARNR